MGLLETDEPEVHKWLEEEAEEPIPRAIDPPNRLHYVELSEEGFFTTVVGRHGQPQQQQHGQ